jgi:hypothetical protein
MADTPSRAEALEAAKALFYSSKDGKVAAGLFVTVHDFIVGAPDAAPAGEPAAFMWQHDETTAGAEWFTRADHLADAGEDDELRSREPVARLLHWTGPAHWPVPHTGIAARTFAEFPKGEGEKPGGYWKEGAPLYTSPEPAKALDDADNGNAVQQVRIWAQEARTQRETVLSLRADERAISASGETKG